MGSVDKFKLHYGCRDLLLDEEMVKSANLCEEISGGKINDQEKGVQNYIQLYFQKSFLHFLQSQRLKTCDFSTLILRATNHTKINE